MPYVKKQMFFVGFFSTIIKFVIPMAIIQLEVLMVNLNTISCLLTSVQREMSTACSFPLCGGKSTRGHLPK